jgi:uncharacterized membrane protein
MTLTIIGLLIIGVQQVFSYMPSQISYVWQLFYPVTAPGGGQGSSLTAGAGQPEFFGIQIFYVLIPWIGVMMAGFGFGKVLLMEPEKRNKLCLSLGLVTTGLFVVIASWFAMESSSGMPFIFDVLNQRKYPPSQLYLMMTIGPLIALVPWAEKITGNLVKGVVKIGRVPMFYYLLHIPLIHLTAFVVNLVAYGDIHQDWYATAPFSAVPEAQRWSLPLLYSVWVIDVIILYFVCRWYADYKSKHPEKLWLKYL